MNEAVKGYREKSSRRRIALVARILIVIGILAMLPGSLSCRGGYSGPVESITVAWSPFEHTALFYVAQDQGLFTENGFTVIPRKYNSGAEALNGVLNGEADIAVGVTEFPLAGRAFQQQNIQTIASIAESNMIYLVARSDRGIEEPSDLKGKRVGTTIGTIAEFYLGRFLELNGMSTQDINLVNLKTPEEWVDAVVNGDIDAISTAQPYANSAKEGLGTNAVNWRIQSGQPMYALVISTNEWIKGHPEQIKRFLRSLVQAEEYANNNPSEAKSIVQKQLDLNDSYIETVWSQNQFGLSLDQSLILAMEDEARWMIGNNLTTEKTVPNFLDYIYTGGLKAVKPDAVRISGK